MSEDSNSSNRGLRVEDLTVRYGGNVANDSIDLVVAPGEVVGLLGPNGAGKTTLIDAMTGFTPYTGRVMLNGESIDALRPHARRRLGLSRTWQSGELFGNLSVGENAMVARRPAGLRTVFQDLFGRRGERVDPEARDVLESVGLGGFESKLARDLTLGQQKLVGVARALMGSCELLLLDEPAAGLDSSESLEFAERMSSIVEQRGPGVLLVDHDVSLVLGLCDRVYVLEFGRLIFNGTPDEARNDAAVVAAYLGAPMEGSDV